MDGIISVDDHVIEPPDMFESRVPARFADRAPRVERARVFLERKDPIVTTSKNLSDQDKNLATKKYIERDPNGEWCDIWTYEGAEMPLTTAMISTGAETPDFAPTTYDDIGLWGQADRLAAMTLDGVDAAMCFPNVVPRFCGQTFLEADDKELGLACIRAYNDWVLDEWCAGDGHGRLLPLTLIPLWDVQLAVEEVQRCAAKGTLAVAFSENPYQLGLPSIHSGEWDPFFRACADSGVVVAMHIGSSSNVPRTSPDAPHIVRTCTHFSVTMGSVLDFVFSGTLERIPNLKLFYAESQAGWLPYVLEQADWLWAKREDSALSGVTLPRAPSSYIRGQITTCIYNDITALLNRERLGIDQICFETDYPHSMTSFPDSATLLETHAKEAELTPDELYKLKRGNAIRVFDLARVGITQ